MTAQEVFDKVARHLLKQGQRSVRSVSHHKDQPECAYRSPSGLKCAVGCLIPDHEYDPRMEGKAVDCLDDFAGTMGELVPAHGRLLMELQQIHDSRMPTSWASELRDLATHRGLSVAALELAILEQS